MNKPLIKIVKRAAENVAETKNEPEVLEGSLKAKRVARREIVRTIAGWIDERREQNRVAEITARRKFFGGLLMNKE